MKPEGRMEILDAVLEHRQEWVNALDVVREPAGRDGTPMYRIAARGVGRKHGIVRKFRARFTRDRYSGRRRYEPERDVRARAQAFADAMSAGGAARERALAQWRRRVGEHEKGA